MGMIMNDIPPLRDAIMDANGAYSNMGSDYSVTDIITPPRIVTLRKRYPDEQRPVSVETHYQASFGKWIHDGIARSLFNVIRKQGPDGPYMIEKRLWDKILNRKVSGQFDCLYGTQLYDFKKTSCWKYVMGDFSDYECQLNLYNYFLTLESKPVDKLAIVALFLDWNKMKLFDTKGYPKEPIMEIPINQWSFDDQEAYMYSKLQVLIDCEELPDEELPDCEQKDMWESPTKWAVYKVGDRSRALRVRDTKGEAQEYQKWYMEKKKSPTELVKRPGTRMRCENYCSVNKFCTQYAKWMEFKSAK